MFSRDKLIKILKNKYFIATVVMFAWLTFFDRDNFIHRIKTNIELQQLRQDKHYYLDKIGETREMKKKLLRDKDYLIRYAREKYLMKKESEDLYVIREKEE